ncbi:uncharacterized protein ARB_02069 [Trichophyton benhamiae CBS 112371]|uniref:2-deoxy-D-gluconate 3-dehydrogenase n=1 Tax=Arthroderma benhamiae (strain ATCC MYA-4681 / CBS 112371) TaxID=663331 RepID=D4B0U3_ARTBC|nr:uncharacterized protein ARB_02069 [Trichophyton benhamiae CBS 112371]EFE30878.1 hypothetical protein ARB_02069 [Trichophyton benhamiae CBS 112371]
MAVGLAEAGADIILVQTRDEILQKTAGKSKVTIHAAELSDRTAAKAIVSSVTADGTVVDILLNCAGIQRRHPSEAFPDQDWDERLGKNEGKKKVLQVNLSAVFTLCREFGAYLLSRGASGSIINMGSLLSYQGGITVPAYAASKGGIAQLTKALSNEWAAKGIRVNAIAPGYIDTDMNTALIQDPVRSESISARIPAGRWGKPEDFKGIAVFLASDASAYVSGEMVNVDGGWMGR